MSVSSWWIVIRTPADVLAWEIGNPAPDVKADLVMRARALARFPAEDGWAYRPELGYDLALTEEPHHKLGAEIRPAKQLSDVDVAALEAYAAGYAQAQHAEQVKAAETMLSSLAPAVVDELLARRRSIPAVTPKGVR